MTSQKIENKKSSVCTTKQINIIHGLVPKKKVDFVVCKVTKTDIPYDNRDGSLTITALMKIRLQKRYKPGRFTFDKLRDEYGIYAIRGPRGVPHLLSEALKK